MDPKTVQYYDDHGDELFALYTVSARGPAKYFKAAFPPGSEILDIGTGSGRDLGILIREQYVSGQAELSAGLSMWIMCCRFPFGATTTFGTCSPPTPASTGTSATVFRLIPS
jgi:hypothetical protein